MMRSLFASAVAYLVFASCTTETLRPERHDAGIKDASKPVPQCPAAVPDACPSPSPSYATDVVPVLDAKCNGCHTGGEGPWPLTNHDLVVHWRDQVLTEVVQCTMPPPLGTTELTQAERTMLVDWLVCGAPDN
jgi:hypothetical protein